MTRTTKETQADITQNTMITTKAKKVPHRVGERPKERLNPRILFRHQNGYDQELQVETERHNRHTYNPEAHVLLSEMRYEEKASGAVGWTYIPRTETVMYKHEMSSITWHTIELLNYIPLNTRLKDEDFKFNKSTLF